MSYTNRLEEAVRQAESASEIARQWANGPENTTVPTESGNLPTLAEFLRSKSDEIDQSAAAIAAFENSLASPESVNILAGVEARQIRQIDGVKKLIAHPHITMHVRGFYAGSSVGGGEFYYDETVNKSAHNGGTIIAPEALAAWNGTAANLSALLNWSGSGSGCFVRRQDDATYYPESFGAADDFTSDNLACQKIIDIVKASGKSGVLYLTRYYKIDKLTFKNFLNVEGQTDKTGFTWREQSGVNTWTGTANVTQGSQDVTVSGDVTGQVQAGNIFRKSDSSWLYVVLSATHSAGTTTVRLHRPYLQSSASISAVTNIVYGMIEYDEGPTLSVDIDKLDIDCAATNRGGFAVYRRAKAAAPTNAGGDWINIWKKVRINQCQNGMWLRGTFSTPYNASLEPNQFSEYQMLNIARASSSDGAALWLTGQVNQQTFIDPILQKYSPTSWAGVNIYVDMEPMATGSGTSNKNPQGIRFIYPTIQGSEFGLLGYAGESIDIYNPYIEYIPKFINIEGYNISNQIDCTLTKPEFKGGVGLASSADGYFMRAGPSARIVLDGGIYKGNDNRWWVNAGGELIIESAPLLVQGIGGYKNAFSDTIVESVLFSSNKLTIESQKAVFTSAAANLDSIEADLWPGETLTVIAENVNGLIIRDSGNIRLPNGRSRLRLRQFQSVELIRNDNSTIAKDWLLKLNRPSVDSRGASFILDEIYLDGFIRITQTTAVTLPSDSTMAGWAAGDSCELVFVGGSTLSFVADSGVTIISAGGVLSTSTVGRVARVVKTGANEWALSFV